MEVDLKNSSDQEVRKLNMFGAYLFHRFHSLLQSENFFILFLST